MKDEDRLYVIVRKDMGKSHRTVQAIHAAINLLARHHGISQNWDDVGPALVVYGATRAQLGRLEEVLPQPSTAFREPDWDNALTAAAFYGRRLTAFDDLALLK